MIDGPRADDLRRSQAIAIAIADTSPARLLFPKDGIRLPDITTEGRNGLGRYLHTPASSQARLTCMSGFWTPERIAQFPILETLQTISLIIDTPRNMGLGDQQVTGAEIEIRAKKLGRGLVPAETALYLQKALVMQDQPPLESPLYMGMEPFVEKYARPRCWSYTTYYSTAEPKIFKIVRDGRLLWLHGIIAYPDSKYGPDTRWVFSTHSEISTANEAE